MRKFCSCGHNLNKCVCFSHDKAWDLTYNPSLRKGCMLHNGKYRFETYSYILSLKSIESLLITKHNSKYSPRSFDYCHYMYIEISLITCVNRIKVVNAEKNVWYSLYIFEQINK